MLAYWNENVRGHHPRQLLEYLKKLYFQELMRTNVIDLIDITAIIIEDYYSSKLQNFANVRNRSSLSFVRKTWKKFRIYKQMTSSICGPKWKNQEESYIVCCQIGTCSCKDGTYGSFYKR